MPQVLCLTESTTLATIVRRATSLRGDQIVFLSNRQLTDATRQTMRQTAPDLILFELNPGLTNLSLYFFLRSDAALSNARIVVLWAQQELDPQVEMLDADAYLCRPLTIEHMRKTLDRVQPPIPQRELQRAS